MLHLIKLCVGIDSPSALARWQTKRAEERRKQGLDPRPVHRTRNMPRRRDELLDGGSLYWVIRHQIRLRQRIREIRADRREDGRPCATLILDPELFETEPASRRPFQGWRYLTPEDAPPDLPPTEAVSGIPPELQTVLERFGIRPWTDGEPGP